MVLTQSNRQPIPALAPVANILPAHTPMPLECDACEHEQNYSMSHLRTLPEVACSQCGDKRRFSGFELKVLEDTLNDMGYYISKSA